MSGKLLVRCPVIHGIEQDGVVFVPGIGIVKQDGKYTELGRQFLKDQIEILEMIIAGTEEPTAS